jgi:hypothetical protein
VAKTANAVPAVLVVDPAVDLVVALVQPAVPAGVHPAQVAVAAGQPAAVVAGNSLRSLQGSDQP